MSAGGETELRTLLATLSPQLDTRRYGFVASVEPDPTAFAVIREEEGATQVQTDPEGAWARITLAVHSSLEAVGLTAAVASALATRGISANIIAALHHDHLFVPWERREEALDALQSLAEIRP